MSHLSNYRGRNTIFALAKQESTCQEMLTQSLNVLFYQGDFAVFKPENRVLSLNEDERSYFNSISEYCVFGLSCGGKLQLYYDVNSPDNPLVLTDRCNSNCIMCPLPERFRREGQSIGVNKLIELAHHIPKFAEHITITGGEPFLIREDIFKLLQYLKNTHPETRFLLLTNGRALASIEYTHLFEASRPKHIVVGIPIHGSNALRHDSIIRTEGGFNETILGIRHLIDIGIPVELRVVVSNLNADDIYNISKLIVSTFPQVLCVKIMGLEMLGNAAVNQDKVWIPYRQAFNLARDAIYYMINAGIDVGLYNFPLCAVDKQCWSICEKSISDYKVRFADACDKCKVKGGCGGVFPGSIRLAKNDVRPIG